MMKYVLECTKWDELGSQPKQTQQAVILASREIPLHVIPAQMLESLHAVSPCTEHSFSKAETVLKGNLLPFDFLFKRRASGSCSWQGQSADVGFKAQGYPAWR